MLPPLRKTMAKYGAQLPGPRKLDSKQVRQRQTGVATDAVANADRAVKQKGADKKR